MKAYLNIIVAFITLFFGSMVSMVSAQNYGTPIPDQLPIGSFAVMENLVDVASITIEARGENQLDGFFYTEINVVGFKNLGEVEEALRQVEVRLKVKNPSEVIHVTSYMKDKIGKEIFGAFHGFYLDKTYENGKPVYSTPYWAIDLYYQAINTKIAFPRVIDSYFVDKNGNQTQLAISDGGIYIPGWSIYGNYDYLLVKTEDGQEYLYDSKTGQRVVPAMVEFDANNLWVEGIHRVDLGEGEWLVLETTPEYNYTPWIEVKTSSNVVYIDIQSVWQYQPIAVWITTLDDIRSGQPPQILSYESGMKIEVNQKTIYVWFEFPAWVYGLGEGQKG